MNLGKEPAPTFIAAPIKNFRPTGGAAFSVSENGVLAWVTLSPDSKFVDR
jgi:hypothetical protein